MSIKSAVAELIGICTYEDECEKLQGMVESLSKQAASYKVASEKLAEEVEYYKNKEDVKELADKYIKMLQIYEESTIRCEAMIDDMDDKLQQMYSRGLAHGRQAAYSEMGIWRLDAIKDGNRLVMDRNGDVYELLELEDVKAEDTGKVTDDEIIIDDLEHIGA